MIINLPKSLLAKHWQKLSVFIIALFTLSSSYAQDPAKWDLLGTFNGHNYYISKTFFFGKDIAAEVALPSSAGGYAAAIATMAENTAIQNFILAYNAAHYGGVSKSTYPHWEDTRNPWIGYSDFGAEGTFSWSNGQPNCNQFINWNRGEPNNYVGALSNGEDFTQMLIMNTYGFNGNAADPNDPLGKWNDWFNEKIIDAGTGQPIADTKLPIVLEIGAADCAPPPPPNRGDEGCSHGYWKNAKTKAWTDAGYARTDIFATVFGVTNMRGLGGLTTYTLQNGLDQNGGGYSQVAKQGVGALLNASNPNVSSFYTPAEVKKAVKEMFNLGSTTLNGHLYSDATSLGSELDRVNNLGCPLNNAGNPSGRGPGGSLIEYTSAELAFSASVYPNPSKGAFSIQLTGNTSDKVSIRVTDMMGRVIEKRDNLQSNQVIKVGENYGTGLYFIEVSQGTEKTQLKLVKASN
jgi:hypothetical protein